MLHNKFGIFVIILGNILLTSTQYTYDSNYGDRENFLIGLITDQFDDEMRIAFEHAIEMANNELTTTLLTPVYDKINYGDSFEGYSKLCNMMQSGVGAVFGPSSKYTAHHLSTVCDAKDVPYFNCKLTENAEGFNLYPDPNDIAAVLHSLLTAYEWKRFIYLYESAEYLNILNTLLALFGDEAPTVSVLRYDPEMNGNYKSVLRRVRKSVDNQILVVGSTDSMASFLKQAQQVGIINEDYDYIFGNLDFHALDLEQYKFSEANITALRIFTSEDQPEVRLLLDKLYDTHDNEEAYINGSCHITMEMALVYDAVQLFAETIKVLSFESKPLNCLDSRSVREDGTTFKNYMRSINLTQNTLTGNIHFEGNIRKGYKFDIVELQSSGLLKVGNWDEKNKYTVQRIPQTTAAYEHVKNIISNQNLTVLISVPNPPYANLVKSYKLLEGNSQFEGYGVDVIQHLASKLGFNYTFKNGGFDYGSYNKTAKVATGMLKEIMEGRADLAITDLTITSERQEAVDFSIPFMNLGISILYRKPQKAARDLFSFMEPFSSEVWWCLGLAFVGVSLSFFILGRLSPVEWDNPYPCIEEPTQLENQFTIGNSLWFTTGALLQQGSEIGPKAISTRTVGSFWWFFTLLIISSYTANLAAFLTIEKPRSVIESIDDLVENKGGVQYGSKREGATRSFFLKTGDPRFKKMNRFMEKNPELLTKDNKEGVERVKSNTNYAFLMESTSIEYNTMRECNLKKIGDALDEKGYGIAMKKFWPYREELNLALIELQEQGVLANLKNKWWNEIGDGICTTTEESSDASQLDMKNLGGVYFVLVVGSCLAVLYGIITWIIFVIRKAKHYDVSLKSAFWEEFKFVVNVHANTRVLKSTKCVYSHNRSSISVEDFIEPDINTVEN